MKAEIYIASTEVEVVLSFRCVLDAEPGPLPLMKIIAPPQRSMDAKWGLLLG